MVMRMKCNQMVLICLFVFIQFAEDPGKSLESFELLILIRRSSSLSIRAETMQPTSVVRHSGKIQKILSHGKDFFFSTISHEDGCD